MSSSTRYARKGLVPTFISVIMTALAILVLPARALAGGGSFTIKTPEVTETSGKTWNIKVRIDLPRPPALMRIPMRLTFSKEVVDERAIMQKGADPVHHRNVLDEPTKQIQSVDVDFANASGNVYKSTMFEFDVRRDGGYFEAGEYQVSLSGPDGDVGGAQKLVLKGDNPTVYRGAMDFTDPKASAKKTQKGPKIENISNDVDGGTKVASNDTPSAAVPGGDVQAEGSGGDMVPSSAYNKTAEEEAVQGHPKGCGCVAAGADDRVAGGMALGSVAMLGLAFVRRRRAA